MTRRFNATIATVIVAGALLLAIAIARAAERPALQRVTGWSVDLHWRDYEATGRGWQRLSGYVATREQCEAIRAATVVAVKGGRLVCRYTDELMMVAR